MVAIGQYEYWALDAAQEFLDDDSWWGIAKHTTQHFLQFLFGLFKAGENQNTLTRTKSIGFEHIGRLKRF